MSNRQSYRTTQQPAPAHYAAVPTSPTRTSRNYPSQLQPSQVIAQRSPSGGNRAGQRARGQLAQSVAAGHVGGMYGPYAHHGGSYTQSQPMQTHRSGPSSDLSHSSGHRTAPSHAPMPPPKPAPIQGAIPVATTSAVVGPQYVWDKDPESDDILHNPDPRRDRRQDFFCNPFSARGWGNVIVLVVLVCGLLMLFAGFPILNYWQTTHPSKDGFHNLGGINGSGQIPDLPAIRRLIDKDTPRSVYTRKGSDGKKYNLVFSDEFDTDGRTFYPGDDPYWEAQDFHYWPTADLEWYDPSAATTADGKLVLTMTQEPIHNLNWKSAMLTTWNKMCFNTGYIEVSISLPGSPKAPGFWPGAWTMGNLGRAGYGATTEGTWPYTYDTCDGGTYPNQTDPQGNPKTSATGGNDGLPLSYLPGQRLSACTCPGSDHPGPSTSTGRGAPEIDIIEAQIDTDIFRGQVSQSFQVAPYNYQYHMDKSGTSISDSSLTKFNNYEGGPFQQAVSAVTYIDDTNYDGQGYGVYGFEVWSDSKHRDEGYIQWYSQGKESWRMSASAVGPDNTAQISQRIVPEEPLYVILNFGMSPGFQNQDFKHLKFPAKMYIDYVRIYQRDGIRNGVTCDPKNRPTMKYIADHIQAYSNPNLTTWAQAGYTFPRNSKFDGC